MPPDHDHDDYLDDEDDDFDERGILKDGRRVRVPLHMMDSVQRSVAISRAGVTDAFGNGGLALHRPGARYASVRGINDADLEDAHSHKRVELNDFADAELCARYRGGLQVGDIVTLDNERNVVTKRDADGRTTLRPLSADEAHDAVEAAYRLYDQEISERWRTPAEVRREGDEEDESATRECDSVPAVDHSDLRGLVEQHRLMMDRLYSERDRELESAWRK